MPELQLTIKNQIPGRIKTRNSNFYLEDKTFNKIDFNSIKKQCHVQNYLESAPAAEGQVRKNIWR